MTIDINLLIALAASAMPWALIKVMAWRQQRILPRAFRHLATAATALGLALGLAAHGAGAGILTVTAVCFLTPAAITTVTMRLMLQAQLKQERDDDRPNCDGKHPPDGTGGP